MNRRSLPRLFPNHRLIIKAKLIFKFYLEEHILIYEAINIQDLFQPYA